MSLLFSCHNLPVQPNEPSQLRFKGVTLVDWTADGYRQASSGLAMQEISRVGANLVVTIVTAYQPACNSSAMAIDPLRTPTVEAVRYALNMASNEGMSVAIKPHVDVNDGSWRAFISPTQPELWFQAYQAFVMPLAELAASVGAGQFVVGTELAGTLKYERLWLETIAGVRAVFSGELVYAASWDESQNVPFWHALDFVG
ncbi:hypothetical protein MJD09_08670, partial [bacterium]|nr:hypothetical protein [bacterium]